MDYIPFLKLKQSEIFALKDFYDANKDNIVPFFDIPRPKTLSSTEIQERIEKGCRALDRYWKKGNDFYIDVFDLPNDISIDERSVYEYLIENILNYRFIPVTGLDREDSHNSVILELLKADLLETNKVAIRFQKDDLEDFELIEDDISALLEQFTGFGVDIDIIIDLRVIYDSASISPLNISKFMSEVNDNHVVDKYILTGSSLSPIVGDYVKTESEVEIPRYELDIYQDVSGCLDTGKAEFIYGDYTVVSPEYSDLNLEEYIAITLTTPKIIYSCDERTTYAVRGGQLMRHDRRYSQYYDLARKIVNHISFRGPGFSPGDAYIDERGGGNGSTGNPASWLRATINAHISYINSL